MISLLRLQLRDIQSQCFDAWREIAGPSLPQTVTAQHYRSWQQAVGIRSPAPGDGNPNLDLLRQNPQALRGFGTVLSYLGRYMGPYGIDHPLVTSEDFNPFRSAWRDFHSLAATLDSLFSTFQANVQGVVGRMHTSALCQGHPEYICCANARAFSDEMIGTPNMAAPVADAGLVVPVVDASVNRGFGNIHPCDLSGDCPDAGDAGVQTMEDAVSSSTESLFARRNRVDPPTFRTPGGAAFSPGTGRELAEQGPTAPLTVWDAGGGGAPVVSASTGPWTSGDIVQPFNVSNWSFRQNSQEMVGGFISSSMGRGVRADPAFTSLAHNFGFQMRVHVRYDSESTGYITGVDYNRSHDAVCDGIVTRAVGHLQMPVFVLAADAGQHFPQSWDFVVRVDGTSH
ncbi:MAG: hypothetical protein HQM15_06690 [Deltaproteobacteria bacterium]|nr:hypothetical protein [Deltaproteobacteria bacterium]